MHGTIVLSDVEIDRPGTKSIRHLRVSGIKLGLRIPRLQQGMLRCIVAHQIQVGVGLICLETNRSWHINLLQQVNHILPGMHPGPADFPFSSEAFAIGGSHNSSFTKCRSDPASITDRIAQPVCGPISSIDADDAIFPDTVCIQNLGDSAGLLHREHKLGSLFGTTHGAITNRPRPDGSHQ